MISSNSLRNFFYLIRKPKYYPYLLSQIKRKIIQLFKPYDVSEQAQQAIVWADSVMVDRAVVFERLIGEQAVTPLVELHLEEFAFATQQAKQLNKTMGGAADIELLYYLTRSINAKTVIETGVAMGWSTLAFLLALEPHKGRLISTDMPYMHDKMEDYVGIVVPEKLKTQWKLIRLPDIQSLPDAVQQVEKLDLCHYDSDKTFAGRQFGYQKLWQALRPDGYFISDDISDNLAFKVFAERVNQQPIVYKFENKHIGILIKPS